MNRYVRVITLACIVAVAGCSDVDPKPEGDNSSPDARTNAGLVVPEVRIDSPTIRTIDDTELDIRWIESAPDEVIVATPGSLRRVADTEVISTEIDSPVDSLALLDGELVGCSVGETPALVPLDPRGEAEPIEGTGGNCERLGIECIFESTETCRLGGSADRPVAALYGFYNPGQIEDVTFLAYKYEDGRLNRYDSFVEPAVVGVLPGGETVFVATTETAQGRVFHKDGEPWIDAPEDGALYVMKNDDLSVVGWIEDDQVSAGVLSEAGLKPFASFRAPEAPLYQPIFLATQGSHAAAAVDAGDVAKFSLGAEVYEYPLENEGEFATLRGIGLTESELYLFLSHSRSIDGTTAVAFPLE